MEGMTSRRTASLALAVLFAFTAGMAVTPAATAGSAGIVAEGTPSATPWFVTLGTTNGPTVLLVGGVHGDEPAGAAAAEQIRHWPITRGRIVVLPRANVTALAAGTRLMPGLASAQGNLNRNFPTAASNVTRGALAAAIWEFVRAQKPDWVVDLHEGGDYNATNRNSAGSSIIVGADEAARRCVTGMLDRVNATVTNRLLRFRQLGPGVDGSLMRAAREQLGARALILETTIKGQPISRRTRQHRVMVHSLLEQLGMIGADVTPDRLAPHAPGTVRPDGRRWVALYDAEGTGGSGAAKITALMASNPAVSVVRVCAEDIRGGALGAFDVLVVPGGSGSRQATALDEAGRGAVRRFVGNGGGYLGICAGAYLATSGFDWSLQILNARTLSPKWQRGKGRVGIEFTNDGLSLLGAPTGTQAVLYANGPILGPATNSILPPYEPLAFFRSEVAENGTPPGLMTGSPALVAGRFGRGRVIVSSPHPEQTTSLDSIIPRAIAWLMAPDTTD